MECLIFGALLTFQFSKTIFFFYRKLHYSKNTFSSIFSTSLANAQYQMNSNRKMIMIFEISMITLFKSIGMLRVQRFS